MKKLLLFLVALGVSQLLVGQISQCGQQRLLDHRGQQFQQRIDQLYEKARHQMHRSNSRSKQLLTVPVVVHIIYNTPAQNISDEAVFSQIEVLNEDFQRLNADAGEARAIFQEVAGNPEIQFVLADTDPEGNPTTGITRTQTEVKTFLPLNLTIPDILEAVDSCGVDITDQDQFLDSIFCINNKALEHALEELEAQDTTQLEDMKFTEKGGIDPWDQDRYINIWVCSMTIISDGQPTVGIAGFATPPVEAPNWEGAEFPDNFEETDGIVVHYEAFGKNTPIADFAGGRTCTHEMGHYFGLRHIFGDGYCADDDGLADTPPTNAFFPPESLEELLVLPSCEEAKEKDTCPEDELPDMIENYMDYSPQKCQNLFTLDQVAIMRSMLEGPRSGLILENTTSTYSAVLDQAVLLYPNPTSGFLQLEMKGFNKEDFTVTIENVLGQQYSTQSAITPLQIGHLEKGLYWIRLSNEEMEVVKKVVLK